MADAYHQGGFTLPGEAGYEALTLRLARKWGADVIRDSDGTDLSDEILNAGYRIYSTVCLIRQHNKFAQAHPDAQQQTFLCSRPVTASEDNCVIPLLAGYSAEQFQLNDTPDSLRYWQVYDRTEDAEVPRENWTLAGDEIAVRGCVPYHRYTASVLCYRVWEEINMYNHTTNHWDSEHLRQLDPRHPAAWTYLTQWLDTWCVQHPRTNVIRLTSLFYNFVWIWGSEPRCPQLFTDWASYDFTVSPAALDAFARERGYALTAEDFVHQGKYQATHMPPTPAKRDYMDFIQRFVADKARALVEIIHRYGKQAYVFYDDSWVGMEPYGTYFQSIGFDGLIKCVFSGFECRLCAGAKVPVHELRFHPYLFPVGLGGLPTFSEGGHPERDALQYWRHVRRALLRQGVDRIGLGGYLHLTEKYPAFADTMEQIACEFRRIQALHAGGEPLTLPCRVAVVHSWGSLRSWTLSGHFHETDRHSLIHLNEALAGLPVQVSFLTFEQAAQGALKDVDVVINAGRAGDAWSGGDAWKNPALNAEMTRFVADGGMLIGVDEPSAVAGYDTYFRLADVLGVDEDTGAYGCHGRWRFTPCQNPPVRVCPEALGDAKHLYLRDGETQVLCEKNGVPQMTLRRFGKGLSVYMSFFSVTPESTRMLLELLLLTCPEAAPQLCLSDNPLVETAVFPADHVIVAVNQSEEEAKTALTTPQGVRSLTLLPMETRVISL